MKEKGGESEKGKVQRQNVKDKGQIHPSLISVPAISAVNEKTKPIYSIWLRQCSFEFIRGYDSYLVGR